jgi:hypothetical protein
MNIFINRNVSVTNFTKLPKRFSKLESKPNTLIMHQVTLTGSAALSLYVTNPNHNPNQYHVLHDATERVWVTWFGLLNNIWKLLET